MRLLFITPLLPHSQADSAMAQTIHNCIKHLSKNYELGLITFVSKKEKGYVKELNRYCYLVEAIERALRKELSPFALIRQRMHTLLTMLADTKPPIIIHLSHKGMAKLIRDVTERENFDIVQIEGNRLSGYVEEIRRGQKILNIHEEPIEPHYRDFKRARNIFKKVYYLITWRRWLKFNRYLYPQFDYLVFPTEAELSRLKGFLTQISGEVIPHGVDTQEFCPRGVDTIPNSIAFLGNYRHPPNVDAVCYFLEKIFPRVQSRIPDVNFFIMGANPPTIFEQLRKKQKYPNNIHITGYIENIKKQIALQEVFVAPLRQGGGIRIKIIQAMSMRKPVVATPLGASGINAISERHFLIASDGVSFANSIIRLLENSTLREKIGEEARSWVETHFDCKAIIQKWEELYQRAVS